MTTFNFNLGNLDGTQGSPLLLQHPKTKQWVTADVYNAYMKQQEAETLKTGLTGHKNITGPASDYTFRTPAPAVKTPAPTIFQLGRYENGSFYIKNGSNPAIAYTNEYEALDALAKKLGIKQPAQGIAAPTPITPAPAAPTPTPAQPTPAPAKPTPEPVKNSGFAPFRDADEYAKKLEEAKQDSKPKPAENPHNKLSIKPETTAKQQIFPHKDGKVYADMLKGEGKETVKIGEEAAKGSKGFWSSVGSAIKNNKGKIALGAAALAVAGGLIAMCSGGDKDNKAEVPDTNPEESKNPVPTTPEEKTPETPAPEEQAPDESTPSIVPTPVDPKESEKPEEGGAAKPGAGVEAEGIKVGGNVTVKDNGKAGIKPITGEVTEIDGDIVTIKDTSQNKDGNIYKIKVTKNEDGTVSYSVISKNGLKATDKNEYQKDKDGNVTELETSESYGRGLRFEAAA